MAAIQAEIVQLIVGQVRRLLGLVYASSSTWEPRGRIWKGQTGHGAPAPDSRRPEAVESSGRQVKISICG